MIMGPLGINRTSGIFLLFSSVSAILLFSDKTFFSVSSVAIRRVVRPAAAA
jgi:hypothetical protein